MIVLHHLNNSRSQRIVWLLEELGLPYELRLHERNAQTQLAPPSLQAVSPVGKAPVIEDGDTVVLESGAIVDYLLRRHGKGRLQPDPASAEYDSYVQWLHYAEGSAMLPLMLNLYVSRLKEAGAPLQARIDSELANHLGYIDRSLAGKQYIMGDDFSGADVQLSFIGEMAARQGRAAAYPHLSEWLERLHARPAFRASVAKGGPYSYVA
jgi:glutathione S-transferase